VTSPNTDTDGDSVRLFEVGPRDGLQNESAILEVGQKVELVERLVDAGARDIEIGSFVHPKWVPQMADTDEVARRIDRRDDVRYWGLVPNLKGLERALEVDIDHIATFMSASETHNQNNVNRSVSESLECLEEAFEVARAEDCELRAYVSTAFGCPFEGDVDFDRVMEIAKRLVEAGADMITLGDTIGSGTPAQVREGCRRALEALGAGRVALHMHDTQGFGIANVLAAREAGVRIFDASVGATGGCPYAPGAAGNVGTEEIVRLFDSMDITSGVDLEETLSISEWLDANTPIDIRSDLYRFHRETGEQREADCVA